MTERGSRSVRWGPAALALILALTTLGVASTPARADYRSTPRTTTWSPVDGRVYAIERSGDTVFIGGSFTAIRGPNGSTQTRSRLAAYDATTGALLPWNPGANGDVRALRASSNGSGLFVGGAFTSIAGVVRSRLAELSTTTGALISAFRTTANNTVLALERIGTRLYVGGGFTTMSVTGTNLNRSRLAALNEANGSFVTGWSASANNQVATLAASPDGDRLFVGGRFTILSGQSRDFVGAVTTATGAASPWRPPIPCTDVQNPCFVFDLAVDIGKVYAAVGGPGGRVVAWDLASAVRRWASYGDGDVQTVEVESGVVYAGGHFDVLWADQPRAGIVALSSSSGGLLTFGPIILGGLGVWAIEADADRLRIGGGFTRIDGNWQRARYAEFDVVPTPPDISPPTVPPNLRTTDVSDNLVSLAWDASTDDVVVAGYQLLRDGVPLATLGTTTYTDRGLAPSTTYRYQVQAADAAGNWSDLSAPLSVTTAPPSNSLVHVGSTWRYLSNGSDQGTAWRGSGFDDSTWSSGDAQLGYGDSDETTVISPLGLTHYFRRRFDVADPASVAGLRLRVLRDDGAVVYVNGTEVWRSNLPAGTITYQTPAETDISGAAESTFLSQLIPSSVLVAGQNTIAVEVHNRSGSTDVSFDLELAPEGAPPPPPPPPQQLLATGSTWRYRDATSAPAPAWASTAYDDTGWASGPSQLGFGDGDEATLLTRGARTFYFRTSFNVADPTGSTPLSLSLLRDDGAIVYLNGTEIYRTNLPAGPVDHTTFASANVSGGAENTFHSFTAPSSLLVAGANVVAVEVHQDATYSSDVSMDLRASR